MNVEDAFGSETEIRAFGFEQAPNEQPGCDEQHEAKGNLSGHEESADVMTARPRCTVP